MDKRFNIIGTGRTGQFVQDFLKPSEIAGRFNSKNPPSIDALQEGDASILFVDGETMLALLPMLLEAGKPLVTGSTGVRWPADLHETLQDKGIAWIHGNNFSLLMNVFFYLARHLHPLEKILKDYTAQVYEVHHVTKKDKPSGTALKLHEALGWSDVELEAERLEHCVGTHRLTFSNEQEKLDINHQAYNRKVYAQGAVWAAKEILLKEKITGFIHFEDVMHDKFTKFFPK